MICCQLHPYTIMPYMDQRTKEVALLCITSVGLEQSGRLTLDTVTSLPKTVCWLLTRKWPNTGY
jgi:hypothetical protein